MAEMTLPDSMTFDSLEAVLAGAIRAAAPADDDVVAETVDEVDEVDDEDADDEDDEDEDDDDDEEDDDEDEDVEAEEKAE